MKTPEHILERNKKYRYSTDGGKSPLNVLKERYRGMVKRCYLERHSSTPEGLCTREEFLDFGIKNEEYHRLYQIWKELGFPRGEAPSIDRIDVTKGYSLDNIQFISFVNNISKSHVELTRQKTEVCLEKEGVVKTFSSGAKAARWLGVSRQDILRARKNGLCVKSWKVSGIDTKLIIKQQRNKRVILQNSEKEEFVFDSVKEAAAFLEVAESSLRTSIRKHYTIKKQYIASYKETTQ